MLGESIIKGKIGHILRGGLVVGNVGGWEFSMTGSPIEVQVDSYYFNEYWYEPGCEYELSLLAGSSKILIKCKSRGQPQVGKTLKSRLIFVATEPPRFINY